MVIKFDIFSSFKLLTHLLDLFFSLHYAMSLIELITFFLVLFIFVLFISLYIKISQRDTAFDKLNKTILEMNQLLIKQQTRLTALEGDMKDFRNLLLGSRLVTVEDDHFH